jgi:hypothetical protein
MTVTYELMMVDGQIRYWHSSHEIASVDEIPDEIHVYGTPDPDYVPLTEPWTMLSSAVIGWRKR